MFKMRVDPKAVLGDLDTAQTKQLPYAVSLALNRVANLGQKAQQAKMAAALHLRRETWVFRSIKIMKADRATKTSWSVIIQVAREFLEVANRLETGMDHLPRVGDHFFVPNVDVFQRKVITTANPLHPMNLHFKKRGKQMVGNKDTFMIHTRARGTTLVLQRMAKGARGISQSVSGGGLRGARGRDAQGRITSGGAVKGIRRGGVRLLYTLVSRAKVPAKFEFYSTISRTVSMNWDAEMHRAMNDAMKSPK